jgi:hypothetical protein
MKALNNHDSDIPEYDFSRGRRGRYAARYSEGTNVILLDPDVAAQFPNSARVNDALRRLIGTPVTASTRRERKHMGDQSLFVERQSDGRYAVKKPHAQRASAVCDTQAKAIERARQLNPGAAIHVERVRNSNNGSRDKWRKL